MGSVRGSSWVVSVAVIGSRIFGLLRELVFAAMFGAGALLDSYLAAFRIPNLMRDLFAEGALSTAFTATFTKMWERDGEKPAWALANLILSAMILIMGVICLVGVVASPILVQITNPGFHGVYGKFELTVELTRIMFPFILFVSLASVVMGVLNARFVFGLPASASTVFNIVSVIAAVTLAYVFDPQRDWRHPTFGAEALSGVTLGVLIGGVAQLAMQLPALWKLGFRFRWRLDFSDPGLKEVWRLMIPSVIAGSAVQVNVLINSIFASHIDGAQSWLNCAFRFLQFPIGVFGVAIATVTLPAVARHHARNDMGAFGRTAEESLRLALFLTLPAAAGLLAIAPQLVSVVYEHGRFTAADTLSTASALRAYAVGLVGYSAIKVLVPCFYALGKPRVPLMVSLLGIGINLVMNVVLVMGLKMGHVGLALSTGVLATVNFVQLVFHLRRNVSIGPSGDWSIFLLKIAASSALAGGAAFAAAGAGLRLAGGFRGNLLAMLVGVAAGVVAYGLATAALRVPETVTFLQGVRRRVTRISRTHE